MLSNQSPVVIFAQWSSISDSALINVPANELINRKARSHIEWFGSQCAIFACFSTTKTHFTESIQNFPFVLMLSAEWATLCEMMWYEFQQNRKKKKHHNNCAFRSFGWIIEIYAKYFISEKRISFKIWTDSGSRCARHCAVLWVNIFVFVSCWKLIFATFNKRSISNSVCILCCSALPTSKQKKLRPLSVWSCWANVVGAVSWWDAASELLSWLGFGGCARSRACVCTYLGLMSSKLLLHFIKWPIFITYLFRCICVSDKMENDKENGRKTDTDFTFYHCYCAYSLCNCLFFV